MIKFSKLAIFGTFSLFLLISNCSTSNKDEERLEPNVNVKTREFADKGGGILGDFNKKTSSNTFEFASSNILWRATLKSLDDECLSYIHDDDKLTFSENYNSGINLVDTEYLVLIHNDMVIGHHFLENLSTLLEQNPNTLLSYTTKKSLTIFK